MIGSIISALKHAPPVHRADLDGWGKPLYLTELDGFQRLLDAQWTLNRAQFVARIRGCAQKVDGFPLREIVPELKTEDGQLWAAGYVFDVGEGLEVLVLFPLRRETGESLYRTEVYWRGHYDTETLAQIRRLVRNFCHALQM